MSSVRFICGTQDIHRELERRLSEFLGTEETILFSSCLDANAGVFEAILSEKDVMIADRLVHASIVDGMRLCQGDDRTPTSTPTWGISRRSSSSTRDKRFRMVITDGVFSMDGDLAKLDEIVALAKKHDAMVFVDDSHASGFIGKTGRGTPERFGVLGKIDVDHDDVRQGARRRLRRLRQRAEGDRRDVPPAGAAVSLLEHARARSSSRRRSEVLDLVSGVDRAARPAGGEHARTGGRLLTEAGFDIKAGESPIVPVMLYNAKLAQDVARDLFAEGIYVVGFFFPVVAKGQARIRTQLSAAHTREHLDRAIEAFRKVGKKHDILGKTKNEIVERYGL